MRIVMFYHSVISDWNHGNAHFLRGVATELLRRGHDVHVYEPEDSWSLRNLTSEHGTEPLRRFRKLFPRIRVHRYAARGLNLNRALEGAEVVIVHEWNSRDLVRRIGAHRAAHGSYSLLFHDTHHRAVTQPEEIAGYDLRHYDGVLAFGQVLRDLYLRRGWARRAWTWHEAADARIFRPRPGKIEGDVVWIGNWGDDERTRELEEFLIQPVRRLGLRARVYGVRYPDHALRLLEQAGIEYAGWLPNYDVPKVFGKFRATVHIPRRPYVRALRGIPTIRPFEAMACGIPLVSSPWEDSEALFTCGRDYLLAADGRAMARQLKRLVENRADARRLIRSGRKTVAERHTCGHRVTQLLQICEELREQRNGREVG